jgi:hypothetical protein
MRVYFLLAILLVPLSASANSNLARLSDTLGLAAIDMRTADCATLTALSTEEKRTFFTMTHFMQSPGALPFVIGPDCSYLGEIQSLAMLDDPKLTIHAQKEILYFSPLLHSLFVPNTKEQSIAYAIELIGGKEPLEYFLSRRKQVEQKADTAKDFAQFVQKAQQPQKVSSSKSSTSTSVDVQSPVRRPVRQSSSSESVALPAAPSGTTSSVKALVAPEPVEDTLDPIQTALPEVLPPPPAQVFEEGTDVSIPQVILGIGIIGLLAYVYKRRMTRNLVSQ